jgi:predicted nuclease with RNAse H fold
MTWLGADPGGRENAFGVAALRDDGSFETKCYSSVDQAVQFMMDWDNPQAVGIDCPMWWTSAPGGGRRVDAWIRKTYGVPSGTVQSINSLRGAVLVQGVLLAMVLRRRHPDLPITETHPKALLVARKLEKRPWAEVAKKFSLRGP